ncbi:DUF397 domain-containing protein [Streptomyces sp. NPDC088725]|uniref:DUF397 domain-containing protein n=1 Tax=Streptomyces sp. NPDC088725 TaxID=3365873 RepID=UPI003814CA49
MCCQEWPPEHKTRLPPGCTPPSAAFLDSLRWSKATASSENNGCVEVADASPWAGVRDSKNPGPRLVVPATAFAALIDSVRAGTV